MLFVQILLLILAPADLHFCWYSHLMIVHFCWYSHLLIVHCCWYSYLLIVHCCDIRTWGFTLLWYSHLVIVHCCWYSHLLIVHCCWYSHLLIYIVADICTCWLFIISDIRTWWLCIVADIRTWWLYIVVICQSFTETCNCSEWVFAFLGPGHIDDTYKAMFLNKCNSKVIPVYTNKTNRASRGITPLILNLGTTCIRMCRLYTSMSVCSEIKMLKHCQLINTYNNKINFKIVIILYLFIHWQ